MVKAAEPGSVPKQPQSPAENAVHADNISGERKPPETQARTPRPVTSIELSPPRPNIKQGNLADKPRQGPRGNSFQSQNGPRRDGGTYPGRREGFTGTQAREGFQNRDSRGGYPPNGSRPGFNNRPAGTNGSRPGFNNRPAGTGGGRPGFGNRPAGTGGGRPGFGNRPAGAGGGRPGFGNRPGFGTNPVEENKKSPVKKTFKAKKTGKNR